MIYNGTDEYYQSRGHLNLTITKIGTIVSNQTVSGKAGETISVEFKVTTNESGVVVNGGHLTVEFDGKEYNSTDVQDGKATFNFGSFDKGLKLDYLVVYYNGTLEFSKSNGYLNLTIIKPEVIVSDRDVKGKVGETISVDFEVNETDGTPVNGGHLTVIV